MMLGSKAPNYDACGLFRAAHFYNPTLASYHKHLTIKMSFFKGVACMIIERKSIW